MTLGFSTVTGSVTLRLLPTSLTPFTSPRFEGDALLHSITCERLLRLKFPNFWEHAQGWYYREQDSRRVRTFARQQYVIFHIVWILSHTNENIHHTRSLTANVQLLNTLMIAQMCLTNERIQLSSAMFCIHFVRSHRTLCKAHWIFRCCHIREVKSRWRDFAPKFSFRNRV